MSIKLGKYFRGAFLKPDDLEGKALEVTIAAATEEMLGETKERKVVLAFADHDQKLVLNRTRLETVVGLFGKNSDQWSGKKVRLIVGKTPYKGKPVATIVIALPAQVDDENDPFADDKDVPDCETAG